MVPFPRISRTDLQCSGHYPERSFRCAAQLQKLLRGLAQGYPPTLYLPSVVMLAERCQCDITAILGGLEQLQQLGYDCRMNSLDLPLTLTDPLCRFRCRRTFLRYWKHRKIRGVTQAGHPSFIPNSTPVNANPSHPPT